MKLPRRKFLQLATGAAALPFDPHIARAKVDPIKDWSKIMADFAI